MTGEILRIERERQEAVLKAARLTDMIRDIIDANDRFRKQLPADWEGDPLNDACEKARAILDS